MSRILSTTTLSAPDPESIPNVQRRGETAEAIAALSIGGSLLLAMSKAGAKSAAQRVAQAYAEAGDVRHFVVMDAPDDTARLFRVDDTTAEKYRRTRPKLLVSGRASASVKRAA